MKIKDLKNVLNKEIDAKIPDMLETAKKVPISKPKYVYTLNELEEKRLLQRILVNLCILLGALIVVIVGYVVGITIKNERNSTPVSFQQANQMSAEGAETFGNPLFDDAFRQCLESSQTNRF